MGSLHLIPTFLEAGDLDSHRRGMVQERQSLDNRASPAAGNTARFAQKLRRNRFPSSEIDTAAGQAPAVAL